jgi:hypothetical protein
LKATCNSRIGVNLPRFSVVWNTLFWKRCNFRRWTSAAGSQVGQAYVTSDLIRAF